MVIELYIVNVLTELITFTTMGSLDLIKSSIHYIEQHLLTTIYILFEGIQTSEEQTEKKQ